MIVVGTTLCAFAMANRCTWASWLDTAEELQKASPERLKFFAAIEVDGRGMEPFGALIARLQELDSDWWTFSLDDGRTRVDTRNRLRHIVTGQNLVSSYASDAGASHLLFMAADCRPPADAIPKLLEVDWPLVGGEVSTYGLGGSEVEGYPFPVQEHMPTAAFVLIQRAVFKRLRWRADGDLGMTDDPCYHYDAEQLLGVRARVRKDVIGRHYPEAIGPIETRFPGRDMSVR